MLHETMAQTVAVGARISWLLALLAGGTCLLSSGTIWRRLSQPRTARTRQADYPCLSLKRNAIRLVGCFGQERRAIDPNEGELLANTGVG